MSPAERIQELSGYLLDAQDEVANWKQETTNARKEVERVTTAASKEIDRLVADIAKLTAHIDRLKDAEEQFNVRLSDMARQRDVLHGSAEELRTEIATLTAEVAKLREHSDHDAGEILRLAGEMAETEKNRNANAVAMAQAVIRADRAEKERDAARAETACKGCGGTVGHHLAPDQGGCPGRFVIDGVPMVPVAHVDAARAEVEPLRRALIAAGKAAGAGLSDAVSTDFLMGVPQEVTMVVGKMRAEVERLTETVAELQRDRQWGDSAVSESVERAAIRDRHEFAASEVERFACEWRICMDLSALEAIKIRAAELRKAAGAAAPADLAIHGSDRTVTMRVVDGKVVEVATPPADPTTSVFPPSHRTPPADRQPMPQGRLEEMRRAYAAGAEKGSMTEPTKSRCRDAVAAIDELIDLRARLAASEKAKAELIAAAREAREYLAFVADRGLCATTNYSTVLQRHIAELGTALAAAERAGGAS